MDTCIVHCCDNVIYIFLPEIRGHPLFINISPLEYGHCLIVPDMQSNLPQVWYFIIYLYNYMLCFEITSVTSKHEKTIVVTATNIHF